MPSDWTPFRPQPPRQAPPLDPIRTLWRLIGPSGKELRCALYRTAVGLEVRAGYAVEEDPFRTQLVASEAAADAYAAALRAQVLALGSFRDVAGARE